MSTRFFGIETSTSLAGVDLGRFWRWWVSELRALLPERLRRLLYGGDERLLFVFSDQSLRVNRQNLEGVQTLRHFALGSDTEDQEIGAFLRPLLEKGYEPVVQLPAHHVLSRSLELPLAVEENLRQVLGFEMDRYTPFKVDQVYYDFRVLRRETTQQRLRVKLFVAPRQWLDERLDWLARWGGRPVAVTVEQDDSVNLLPVEKRLRKQGFAFTLNRLLLALAGMLLVASIAFPLWGMRNVVANINRQMPTAQRLAHAVQGLRAERDALLEKSHFLIDKKQARPPVIEVLSELTRILPDNTWLSSFKLNEDTVLIQGESPASSDLIEIIEASPYFQETGFRAPVTKNPRSGLEEFQIGTLIRLDPDQ